MEYLVGLILAVAVAGFATIVGLDRERAFYPTVLIVVASYYVLFAVMGRLPLKSPLRPDSLWLRYSGSN